MKIRGTDFFGYEVADINRSISFYRDTLGLPLGKHIDSYDLKWAEFDAPPTTLGLYVPSPKENRKPDIGGGHIMLAVDDIHAALKKLKSENVRILSGPIETPVCFMAFIFDPDGNKIGLHQHKDGACC